MDHMRSTLFQLVAFYEVFIFSLNSKTDDYHYPIQMLLELENAQLPWG